MPADIGAYEAKTHLPALLQRVARGERITITKHGRPVARLVPIERTGPDRRREAIERLKRFREGQTLTFRSSSSLAKAGGDGSCARRLRRALLVLQERGDCHCRSSARAPCDRGHLRPAIWHLEIANVLALSERRGRITPANSSEFIALLETLTP